MCKARVKEVLMLRSMEETRRLLLAHARLSHESPLGWKTRRRILRGHPKAEGSRWTSQRASRAIALRGRHRRGHPQLTVARALRGQHRRRQLTDREVEKGLPGTTHPSHYALPTDHCTFCGLCGVYRKQLRKCALQLRCPREPRNRYAGIARDKLLRGPEPHGRGWRQCMVQ